MKIKQKFYKLSQEEKAAIQQRREAVESRLPEGERDEIDSIKRLSLVDKILYEEKQKDKERDLLGASIVLGEVFVYEDGFHWVAVQDIHGRDFVLKHGKMKLILNPRLLVLKLIDLKGKMCARDVCGKIWENIYRVTDGIRYQRAIEDFLSAHG